MAKQTNVQTGQGDQGGLTNEQLDKDKGGAAPKQKVSCKGAVIMLLVGGDARSLASIKEGTGAELVSKEGNGFLVNFPLNTDLIKASRADGISSYGAIYGFAPKSLDQVQVMLEECEPGMLDTLARLVQRSEHHLSKLGVTIMLDPDDRSVNAMCEPVEILEKAGHSAYDVAVMQTTVAVLLISRAYKALNYTQHPLSFFDLEQAIGVIDGVKKEAPDAVRIHAMLDTVLKPAPKPKKPKAEKAQPKEKPTLATVDTGTAKKAMAGGGKKKKPAMPPANANGSGNSGEDAEPDPQQ